MRTFRAHNALISAAAGAALAMAGTAPAHAQFFGFNFNFGFGGGAPSVKAAAQPAATDAKAPLPPADVPTPPPVQLMDGQSDTGTAPAATAAAADGDATPVAPDAPVAAANLAAPGTAAASAADAALNMANMMDGAGGGVSNADLMSSLENAAAAGQPMALWRLGTMYENGEGVAKDDVKAFGYFSQIANDHADAAPRGVDADIVAQSFVKMGDYYRQGLPDAGIDKDPDKAEQLVLHAATYFGNADAQYRVGEIYLNSPSDPNPLQGARWLSLAAHKGHLAAQAKLGDLLFNGAGIKAQPTEGLMWLSIARDRSTGTADEGWITELLTRDMSVASPDQRAEAIKMAGAVEPQFAALDAAGPAN
ncbi:MAG: tetratricopeptide repeat protein [Devosia sp.]|nr:tetratricopeptide repeat protein [Devosia sp.]